MCVVDGRWPTSFPPRTRPVTAARLRHGSALAGTLGANGSGVIVLCQIVNAILYSVLVLPICLVKVFETISYITLKRYFNRALTVVAVNGEINCRMTRTIRQ